MSPHVTGTTPYPWPFDGDLRGGATALLVVAPAAEVAVDEGPAHAIGRLARAVRGAGGAVVVAATTAPAVPAAHPLPAPAQGPSGLLDGEAVDVLVTAGGVDAFYGSDLDLVLRTRGVSRVVLAGAGLETCIHSTMRDANDRGYECLLVIDACAAIDPDLVVSAVSMVEMSGGIFGAVGRTDDVVAALRDVAARARTASPARPLEGAQR